MRQVPQLPSEIWERVAVLLVPDDVDSVLIFRRKFSNLRRLSLTCRHVAASVRSITRPLKSAKLRELVDRATLHLLTEPFCPCYHHFHRVEIDGAPLFHYGDPDGKFVGTATDLGRHLRFYKDEGYHHVPAERLLCCGQRDRISLVVSDDEFTLGSADKTLRLFPLKADVLEQISSKMLDDNLSGNQPKIFQWFKMVMCELSPDDSGAWREFCVRADVCNSIGSQLLRYQWKPSFFRSS